MGTKFHEWGGGREWEGWGEVARGGLRAEGDLGEIDD